MARLPADLRHGLRSLARSRGLTAIAVLVLALGIGANTAIFTVVNSVLLRRLPYREPERLVLVSEQRETFRPLPLASGPAFLDWRAQNKAFDDMAAYDYSVRRVVLTGSEEPSELRSASVTSSLFSMLGVPPAAGRTFNPDEEEVVILGHGLWQRRFGSDPRVVGRSVTLAGRSFAVIGVMPAGFDFPHGVELWMPLNLKRAGPRGARNYTVLGRLKPGVTIERARTDMQAMAARLEQDYPEYNKGWRTAVVPLREHLFGNTRPALLVLVAAVGFVLLIACANVANLLLARAAARQRELAIRMALGAGRWKIVSHVLSESALLAAGGAIAGFLLAGWGVRSLRAILPAAIPRGDQVSVDLGVLGFTVLVAVFTGLAVGLVPAIQVSHPDLVQQLKEGGRTTAGGAIRTRARSLLVVTEVALASVLLIGAGLMIKTFVRVQLTERGFQPENRLTMRISLPRWKYSGQPPRAEFFRQLLEKIGRLPEVRGAGAVFPLPFSGEQQSMAFSIVGAAPVMPSELPYANLRAVTPDYFRAMGIQVVAGRLFSERDIPDRPLVALINESMARAFWPRESAVGKRIVIMSGPRVPTEIVGVVADVRHTAVEAAPGPELYIPYFQRPWYSTMFLVIDSGTAPAALAAAVRGEVFALDREQPIGDVRTMTELVAMSVAPRRFSMLLVALFAGVALALAAAGIYGVISYSVAQRTHEIGVRLALGARPSDAVALIVREGMLLALCGLAIGLVAARLLSGLMASVLFEVGAADPSTFALVPVVLLLVAFLATYLPARRVTKVDPIRALRHE